MSTPDPISQVREGLIRVEGKLDAYAAGQSARLDSIDKRLDGHDDDIDELRRAQAPHHVSGWTIAAAATGILVALSGLVGLVVTLIQAIP